MINDIERNEAYFNALKQVIVPNESLVVDLGAGLMLLSMISKRLGAKAVIAIERNKDIVHIAKEILALNNMTIRIIEEESFFVDIDRQQIPRQPDILVSETLDGWIIGEGFLSSLNDFRSRQVLLASSIGYLSLPHSIVCVSHLVWHQTDYFRGYSSHTLYR